ncbi:MAG: DUF488 family protein [Chloroflexi bacterium]|nr:DUF488 family protein [Chloroflexota bacterium]
MAVRVKRAYQAAAPEDGMRVLVDRYWPRGVRKEEARIDAWMKQLAPSAELIRWFGHRPERWEEFRRRYGEELERGEARGDLAALRERAGAGTVTLVYGARDEEHNNAVALAAYLRDGE